MLTIGIKINSREIAKIEATCNIEVKGSTRAGKHKYNVTYTKGDMVLKFEVWHVRVEGIAKLLKILANKIQAETKWYYRIPKDKIVKQDRMKIVCMNDVPEQYRNRFAAWMNGQTGTVYRGKIAVYLGDLERWIASEVAGIKPLFD